MSLDRLHRKPWLRTAMRVLLLCFALGTLAYAGHTHAPTQIDTHYSCDFCTGFGGLIDAPVDSAAAVQWSSADEFIAAPATHVASRPVGFAQARAPPIR